MRAKVSCRLTETEELVSKALASFFPDMSIQKDEDGFFVESGDEETSLLTLKEKVWEKKILDTVRGRLIRSECDGQVSLLLNKQAALVGRLSVCDSESESPLGAISVSFSSNLIDWFSPKTKEGKPI